MVFLLSVQEKEFLQQCLYRASYQYLTQLRKYVNDIGTRIKASLLSVNYMITDDQWS